MYSWLGVGHKDWDDASFIHPLGIRGAFDALRTNVCGRSNSNAFANNAFTSAELEEQSNDENVKSKAEAKRSMMPNPSEALVPVFALHIQQEDRRHTNAGLLL